ncbi:MAG: hypothetical protein FJX54_01395 [Alphaproteobacteria bacterium]|nr:hypothetical protein [Alphaproteobacteria bacterium]
MTAELIAFLPIIVLMIATRLLPRRIALLVSLGTAAVTLAPWVIGTGTPKQFSLVLAALIAASFAWHMTHAESAERWSGLMLTAGVALYAFVSITLGHPFAEQWAHERVKPELWTHPLTIHIVTTITWVWGVIYVALSLNTFPRERFLPPEQVRTILPIVLVVAGIAFSIWYPAFAVANR